MKRLYLFSQSLSRQTPFSLSALYLLFRTTIVFLLSFAASVLLSYFVSLKGTTPTVFVIIVCGWITISFGFLGGIFYLMNHK